jgi:hypothetical protein
MAVEGFNSKMLFNPFHEKFNLPAIYVELANLLGTARSHIRQQGNMLIVFLINQTDTSK